MDYDWNKLREDVKRLEKGEKPYSCSKEKIITTFVAKLEAAIFERFSYASSLESEIKLFDVTFSADQDVFIYDAVKSNSEGSIINLRWRLREIGFYLGVRKKVEEDGCCIYTYFLRRVTIIDYISELLKEYGIAFFLFGLSLFFWTLKLLGF